MAASAVRAVEEEKSFSIFFSIIPRGQASSGVTRKIGVIVTN
jgi:hypothetical protein